MNWYKLCGLLGMLCWAVAASAAQTDINIDTEPDGSIRLSNIADDLASAVNHGHEAVPTTAGKTSLGLPYDKEVHAAASQTSLDPALLHAIIAAESHHNPVAVSPKGARGLMQLMPETAQRFAVKNSYDPAQNIQAGARYLRELHDAFHGNLKLILAAYNAGPAAVMKNGGRIPPYAETREYVPRVLKYYREFSSQ